MIKPLSKTLENLKKAEEEFKGTWLEATVLEAKTNYLEGRLNEADRILENLPDKKQLWEDLIHKLRGKPVHKTINRILYGKTESKYEHIKCLFSLGTHLAIECQSGNEEYKIFLEDINRKIGKLIYEVHSN